MPMYIYIDGQMEYYGRSSKRGIASKQDVYRRSSRKGPRKRTGCIQGTPQDSRKGRTN